MNLRQWARATRKAMASQPPEFRQKDFSMVDVEMILRQSVRVLVESLQGGDDLRLHDLGRLWVEHRAPHTTISNLPGQKKRFDLGGRKVVRFRASAELLRFMTSGMTTDGSHAHADHKD